MFLSLFFFNFTKKSHFFIEEVVQFLTKRENKLHKNIKLKIF